MPEKAIDELLENYRQRDHSWDHIIAIRLLTARIVRCSDCIHEILEKYPKQNG